jgi:hypothetical protein
MGFLAMVFSLRSRLGGWCVVEVAADVADKEFIAAGMRVARQEGPFECVISGRPLLIERMFFIHLFPNFFDQTRDVFFSYISD